MKSPFKHAITVFLAFASIVVWGIVGLRVFKGLETVEKEKRFVPKSRDHKRWNNPLELTEKIFLQRIQLVKNPFQPEEPRRIKVNKRPDNATAPEVFLQITYIGYVKGESGSMAIIEGKNEQTRFCMVGDTVFGVKIVSIRPAEIGVQKGKITNRVPLRRFVMSKEQP